MTTVTTPRLTELEAVIERGIETFAEVGLALTEIRDNKLYLKNHATFSDYCRQRWGWSRQRGYQLMDAAGVSTVVDIQDERQARELVPLLRQGEQQVVEVWRELKEAHGEKVTAQVVRVAVRTQLQRIDRDDRRQTRREEAQERMNHPYKVQSSEVSNGIVPLEAFWATPRSVLQRESEGRRILIETRPYSKRQGIRKHALLTLDLCALRSAINRDHDPEVRAVPAAAEVFSRQRSILERLESGIDGLVKAANRELSAVAGQLAILADDAPETRIPWGAKTPEQQQRLLQANFRQKNSRGYCGQLGCWEPVAEEGRCEAHNLNPDAPPEPLPIPAKVYEPASEGSPIGRPGFAAWGLEALDLVGGSR